MTNTGTTVKKKRLDFIPGFIISARLNTVQLKDICLDDICDLLLCHGMFVPEGQHVKL
jgi:hypothetical protein